MSNLLNPSIELLDDDKDLKAFIYQLISEFEPYVTPSTEVIVMARDPRKLAIQLETDGRTIEPAKLREMHRIAIVLKEDDTKIEAEGLHDDIYEALRIAKTLLIKQLSDIHDSVVSNQDRQEQINFALSNPQLH